MDTQVCLNQLMVLFEERFHNRLSSEDFLLAIYDLLRSYYGDV